MMDVVDLSWLDEMYVNGCIRTARVFDAESLHRWKPGDLIHLQSSRVWSSVGGFGFILWVSLDFPDNMKAGILWS